MATPIPPYLAGSDRGRPIPAGELLTKLLETQSVEETCRHYGISKSSLHQWLRRNDIQLVRTLVVQSATLGGTSMPTWEELEHE